MEGLADLDCWCRFSEVQKFVKQNRRGHAQERSSRKARVRNRPVRMKHLHTGRKRGRNPGPDVSMTAVKDPGTHRMSAVNIRALPAPSRSTRPNPDQLTAPDWINKGFKTAGPTGALTLRPEETPMSAAE